MLIARIFPRPCGARKNTTQLAKYPHVLYSKPSNKVYLLHRHWDATVHLGVAFLTNSDNGREISYTGILLYETFTTGIFACFYWHTQTNFRFWQKVSFSKGFRLFRVGWFSRASSLYYLWKKLQCSCQEKKYAFLIQPVPIVLIFSTRVAHLDFPAS